MPQVSTQTVFVSSVQFTRLDGSETVAYAVITKLEDDKEEAYAKAFSKFSSDFPDKEVIPFASVQDPVLQRSINDAQRKAMYWCSRNSSIMQVEL